MIGAPKELNMSNRFGLLTKDQQDQLDKVVDEKNKLYLKVSRLKKDLTVARNEINRLKSRNSTLNKKYQDLLRLSFKKE